MMQKNPNTHELYRQGQLPVFQNRMYDSREEAINCPKGDVSLVEDLDTGLAYNAAFDADLMVYDSSYQNEQANSAPFRVHLEQVSELVRQKVGRENLVEVGCGKGYFLEMLQDQGCDITGFDPTYEGSNPRVKREYFGPGLGMSGDGLILRHVLEHIVDPVSFLMQLAEANGNRGLIYIEVPCFDWICQNRTWYDIFYEHVNYFRLSDFKRIFGRVVHAEHVFGGQYLAVIGDLSTLRTPVADPDDRVDFPADFTATIPDGAKTGKAVVWGGASKGVIFSLLAQRAGYPVAAVIDINPAKQGKYLAATGLQVQSPEQALAGLPEGADIYVMNPNYLSEIRELSGNKYNYIEVDKP